MEKKNRQDLATAQSKETLPEKNLASGSKTELVVAPRSSEQLTETDAVSNENEEMSKGGDIESMLREHDVPSAEATKEVELMRRRLELLEKEKELAIREAQLARRELELARLTETNTGQRPTRTEIVCTCITAVADLLNHFDGSVGAFEIWTRQLRLLRNDCGLSDDVCRILILSRLRGKALDWFHSRPEHVAMTIENLLEEMGSIFSERPNRLTARRRFEERTWQRGESFADYLQQKVILANRISLGEEERIDYIVDGIPDPVLQCQARLRGFKTNADLLEAFSEITLRTIDKSHRGGEGLTTTEPRSDSSAYSTTSGCVTSGDQKYTAKCPKEKEKAPRKSFERNEYGGCRVSRESSAKRSTIRNVVVGGKLAETESRKEVRVNDCDTMTDFDMASDVSLVTEKSFSRARRME